MSPTFPVHVPSSQFQFPDPEPTHIFSRLPYTLALYCSQFFNNSHSPSPATRNSSATLTGPDFDLWFTPVSWRESQPIISSSSESSVSSLSESDDGLLPLPPYNTPETSPAPFPENTAPNPHPNRQRIMPMEDLSLFYGDGRTSENPHVFIKKAKQKLSHLNDDNDHIENFKDFLFPSGPAEVWYEEVMEGEAPPVTWKALVAKFEKRWPKPVQVKKGPGDYVTELSAYRMPEDELGRKVEKGGVEVWSHIKMADELNELAHNAGIHESDFLIVLVWHNLPSILQGLVSSVQKDWTSFRESIKAADIEFIKKEVKKLEQEKEKEKEKEKKEKELMEKYDQILGMAGPAPETPTRGLTGRFAAASLGVNVPAYGGPRGGYKGGGYGRGYGGGGGFRGRGGFGYMQRGGLFRSPQCNYTHLTEEQRKALRHNATALPQHPNTTAGCQAYEAQKAEWAQRWGGNATLVTYEHPYPLELGTSNVCTGECFQCGKCGHWGDTCQTRTLNEKEKAWRRLCSNKLGPYL
ncbi:hypothetical protein D9758_018302 [Tetrapyrgos nigripes]|uniref:CCHC-type domain-containing protein n=1 Tax=Tetrapyrgos nigripes TaxID=182062 RepID=A0A8H5BC69_9AGAR|nr:hypothetical protein D9758_018302 [Tetrapyrgos nigripes]